MVNEGERLGKIINLKNINDKFKISYGTYNKKNPTVIFINIETWVKPINDKFIKKIDNIKNINVKSNIKNFTDVILFTKIANKQMKLNKKTFLSFELHFKQNKYSDISDNKLQNDITKFITKFLKNLTNKENFLKYEIKTKK